MLNLIAAVGKNGQIGLNGQLSWRDSEDLKWFKKMTMGCTLVAGGRTASTLPPLPGRELLIYTRDNSLGFVESIVQRAQTEEIWVIGGARVYSVFAPFVNRFYISQIDYTGPADTFLPDIIPHV
jgi:dihydrofolate reductase